MDNFRVDVTSIGKESLINFMKAAFSNQKAVGYAIIPDKGMIFFWAKPNSRVENFVPFPFKLDAAGCADFALRWLDEAAYGRQPDHDGDNEKGWRLFNESCGFVNGWNEAFVAIAPVWAMYGK